MELQTKSCESYFIPTKMLKENIDRFLDAITEVINLSLFKVFSQLNGKWQY